IAGGGERRVKEAEEARALGLVQRAPEQAPADAVEVLAHAGRVGCVAREHLPDRARHRRADGLGRVGELARRLLAHEQLVRVVVEAGLRQPVGAAARATRRPKLWVSVPDALLETADSEA